MDNGHWIYPEIIDVERWFGFIYRITNLKTNQQYIGKKQFWAFTRKKVAGRTNRKKIIKESDWKTYTGSSSTLNDLISSLGKENFLFVIESLHETKGSLFYEEVRKQISENVLREKLQDGSIKFYNRQIAGVRFIPPEPTPDESTTHIMNHAIGNTWYGKLLSCRLDESERSNPKAPEDLYGTSKSKKIKKALGGIDKSKK
jgi:hypothetical protein